MRARTVGIIGGGPGGLMTAYALQKHVSVPLRVTLYEASPRLGGKILTPRFQSMPLQYEAGAAEFYDYSQFDDDPLKDLIAELGLPIRPMGGSAVVMNEQVIANQDDFRDRLGPHAAKAWLDFDQSARDRITPLEFYHADDLEGGATVAELHRFDRVLSQIGDAQARRYVEHMIHSDLATEPRQTSQEYGLQNYLMNAPEYMRLYGIEGGNDRLPQALAAWINARFRMEHRVTNIAKVNGALRVTATHQTELRQDDFDYVVVALPHNQVPSLEFGGERLAAAVQRHQAHYDHPAHYLRITLLFSQPFWRKSLSDSYWMLDQFGGCCLYEESSRVPECKQGILGWLLGGNAARTMSHLSDDELVAKALESLPEFLAHGRRYLVEGRVHRWIAAVNAMPGGVVAKKLDQRHQPEPIDHPNLFLVGDYLFDSTLNGVLDSAEYVASWIAAELTDHPK